MSLNFFVGHPLPGASTHVFGSGMGAITAGLLAVVSAGDHVVAQTPVYSGTHEMLAKVLPRYGPH